MDIDKARKIVDEADKVIVDAFVKRMNATYLIGEEKVRIGKPVFDPEREAKVIASRCAYVDGQENKDAVEELYRAIMTISKQQQQKLVPHDDVLHKNKALAVFMGTAGSYGEEAAETLFGKEKIASVQSFSEVFDAVQSGEAEFGVVPVENSSTGSIMEVYDLLLSAGLYITHEAYVRVSHTLLAPFGATLDTIKEVMSHEQALFQSREFLKQYPGWKQHKVSNTAVAAQRVSFENSPHKAAIASERCAKLYNLDILKRETNFGAKNSTRFVAVSKKKNTDKENNKCSVAFELLHSSGSLCDALQIFKSHNLNLLKIESRPVVDNIGKYVFFLDFLEDEDKQKTALALAELEKISNNYKFIGSYCAAKL